MKQGRCYFTESARAAAAAKRREKIGLKAAMRDSLDVFVVRTDDASNRFVWEIRRFGALTVRQSPQSFDSATLAREAGEAALAHGGIQRPQPKLQPQQG